ncbi:MAG: alpha-amylase family glycosyl hydrolase [Eubacteriales bacterium]
MEGVGGFRLDVADELSDEFLSELKSAALAERDDCVIIGEVWENAAEKVSYGRRRRYLRGKELDSVMNYPIRTAIISYLRDGDCETFLKNTAEVYGEYPDFAQSALMNIIGTHDTIRIITALAGESPEGKSQDERAVYKMTEAQYSKGVGL